MNATEYSVDKEQDGSMELKEKCFFIQFEVYLQNSLLQGNVESNVVAGLENERRNILLPRTKCVIQYDLKKKKNKHKKDNEISWFSRKVPCGTLRIISLPSTLMLLLRYIICLLPTRLPKHQFLDPSKDRLLVLFNIFAVL